MVSIFHLSTFEKRETMCLTNIRLWLTSYMQNQDYLQKIDHQHALTLWSLLRFARKNVKIIGIFCLINISYIPSFFLFFFPSWSCISYVCFVLFFFFTTTSFLFLPLRKINYTISMNWKKKKEKENMSKLHKEMIKSFVRGSHINIV